MFGKRKLETRERCSQTRHPDFEQVNTSVAEYFRKYAVGKSDRMPIDPRSEVTDGRSAEEMLDDDSKINHLGCDDLDALMEMQQNEQKFKEALSEIELSEKQAEVFKSATKILEDPNSTVEQRRDAYESLEELHDKVTRARKL